MPNKILNFEELNDLEEQRLIKIDTAGYTVNSDDSDTLIMQYFSHKVRIKLKNHELITGNIMFTQNGETLGNIIDRVEQDYYFDYIMTNLLNKYETEIIE